MKNKDLPIYALLDFLSLLISCVAAQLFTKLILRFAVLFVELDYASASAVRLVTLLLISLGIFAFLGYKEGYREGFFRLGETIPQVGIASGVHFLICLALRFTPWLAGPTLHIAGFLSLGSAYNMQERIENIPFGMLALVGLFMALLWSAAFLLASYLGARNRLADRAELMGETK